MREISLYMTHLLKPLIVFEERAAKQIKHGLKSLSFFAKPEIFPEDLPEVSFLEFHAGVGWECPRIFSETLPEVNGKKNNHSLKYKCKAVKIY